jgi:hypothetical protein
MSRTFSAVGLVAAVSGGLMLAHGAGAYVLDELGLSERLFAGDAASAASALLVLMVVSSRVVLAFALPACVVLLVLAWVAARRSS